MNKRYDFYGPKNHAIFNAMYSATGQPLLVSECEDFESSLNREGYGLRALTSKVGAQRRSAERKRSYVSGNGRSHEIDGMSAAVPASANRRSAKAVSKKKK